MERQQGNSFYIFGIIIGLLLVLYGMFDGAAKITEIIEHITNNTIKYTEPEIVTKVNKTVIEVTATPAQVVQAQLSSQGNNDFNLPSPAVPSSAQVPAVPATEDDEVELRAITPVPLTPTPMPVVSTSPPQVLLPTYTAIPPTAIPPTAIPPTAIPPTAIPPTAIPPTAIPPTAIPPTAIPPTAIPPTAIPPTAIPPTAIPPTAIPPTAIPPTLAPITPVPAAVVEDVVIEEIVVRDSLVTGHIEANETVEMTLSGSGYFNGYQTADGSFEFYGVPPGSYKLEVLHGNGSAHCADLTLNGSPLSLNFTLHNGEVCIGK